jgi:UDPglucose 6-dehydrogenase
VTIPKTVSIIGTGYVGMASAIGLAELGHQVYGYDIQPDRIRALQRGITPYHEAGIEEPLQRHLGTGRIAFFEDIAQAVGQADFVIVTVGTPSLDDGAADLSAVRDAVASVVPVMPEHAVIVLRSTVPAGTTNQFAEQYDAEFVYAPEFLREGSAVADFLGPDRIVVGAASMRAGQHYARLLAALDRPVLVTSYRNAELVKSVSNAFLALKISFANEVANLCDVLEADALEVLRGVGEDRRIGGEFLAPGIGFGGPCFEKDVRSLCHVAGQYGAPPELLTATLRVNESQPRRIVDVLEEELGGLAGARIAVWGLTFKAGTDDVRDSLALRIIDDLRARGAIPLAYDPAIALHPEIRCELAFSALDALDRANGLLVLTEWPEFAAISPYAVAARLEGDVVVDGRNVLDPQSYAAAGLRFRGVGRRPATTLPLAAAS